MTARTTLAGLQTTGGPAPSAFANSVAGGWIGYASRTADQTGITTEIVLAGMQQAVTVGPSRMLWIRGVVHVQGVNGDESAELRIKEGSTVLDSASRAVTAAGGPGLVTVTVETMVVAPATGSHTYSLALARTSGTGTIASVASGTKVEKLIILDVGPSA